MSGRSRVHGKMPPEANRILFVRNLPYKISDEELYGLFGKYGSIRQVRKGVAPNTLGTAFVVYDDVLDAATACQHLSGFNVHGRYLVVLFHRPVLAAGASTRPPLVPA